MRDVSHTITDGWGEIGFPALSFHAVSQTDRLSHLMEQLFDDIAIVGRVALHEEKPARIVPILVLRSEKLVGLGARLVLEHILAVVVARSDQVFVAVGLFALRAHAKI